jgi:hypothetical protein
MRLSFSARYEIRTGPSCQLERMPQRRSIPQTGARFRRVQPDDALRAAAATCSDSALGLQSQVLIKWPERDQ